MANGCAFPRLCSSSQVFSVVEYPFHWIRKVWQPSFRFYLVSRDSTHLIFLYSVYKVWWWLVEIGAMFHSLLIGSQKRCMENWMDVPPRWDAKVEGCVGHYFFNFKETSPFHLELPPPPQMEVCHFQPYLITNLPWDELGCDLLLHLLLGHLVDSLGIILGGKQVRHSFLQIRKESFAKRRIGTRLIAHHERERSLGHGIGGGIVHEFHHRQ